MDDKGFRISDGKVDDHFLLTNLGFHWNLQNEGFPLGSLFASIAYTGKDVNPPNSFNSSHGCSVLKLCCTDLYKKYVSATDVINISGGFDAIINKEKKKWGFKLKVKVENPSLRRLISGAVAGAVSRTAVAPLETIRTHLMLGNSGHSTAEVFNSIMKIDGWKGLFAGNFVNVIRVAPSKAIELFSYDTINKSLSPKRGEQLKLPIPPSLIAGAVAGITSTLCTYPLELIKTRLTIQRGVYNGFLDAFVKILREGGPSELYRGLTPSLIGVIPYSAINYYAYDTLRKAYKKIFKQEEIGNIETLLIGSLAGAISSSVTYPLEVARKHMQMGALSGREVYRDVFHALASILEHEGIHGLYRGVTPSCIKLVPAAGISFMCYEACKRILVENEED